MALTFSENPQNNYSALVVPQFQEWSISPATPSALVYALSSPATLIDKVLNVKVKDVIGHADFLLYTDFRLKYTFQNMNAVPAWAGYDASTLIGDGEVLTIAENG